jgi:serine protease Do
MRGRFLVTLGAVAALALVPAWGGDATGEARGPLDFEAVIEHAKARKARIFPALVFVRPVQEDLSAGERRRVEVFGSGFIVSADGYVVTNHHVAEKAREIRCVLADRRQVDATVVGLDEPTDLALLKLALPAGERVAFAELPASADLVEGQFVMALGAPYGFERSISLGIVSNARRNLADGSRHAFNNWIQTDAAINPGNSGGPLVDTRGSVVGVNTLGVQLATSLGFAIPVDVVRRVIDRLRTDGRVLRSWSGLTLRPLVDYAQGTVFGGEKGVIVDDVAPGSPAEKAGILQGDRVLTIGGRATDGRYREDLPEILWTLSDLQDGRPAVLELERDGASRRVTLVPELCDGCDVFGFEAPRWGATFQAISRERVPDLAFHRRSGVYALGVKFPGRAADAGLREGDVVVSVDRIPVGDLAGLAAAYERTAAPAGGRRTALLEVLRDGRRAFLAIDLGATDGR